MLKSPLCIVVIFLIFSLTILSQDNIGDGGKATDAVLESPSGIAVDKDKNLYIAERRGNRIRKVDSKTGIITTYVGTGERGFSGDGGKASAADISIPELIAFDSKGNLLITDRGNGRIRRIDSKTGIIETLVGTGENGYAGDGGKASNARISSPFGVGVDNADNVYFADTENHAIRKIDAKTGIITTVAGNGSEGFSGDRDLATKASLKRPHNFLFDERGNLIIGDSFNLRIRVVDGKTKKIETLYGIGEVGFSKDGTNALKAKFGFFGAFILTKENLVFSEWINKRIRLINRKTGIITSLKDSTGKPLEIDGPYGIASDKAGFLYVAEANKNRVLKINLRNGDVIRFAGK